MRKTITIVIIMIWGAGFGQGEIKDELPVVSPQTPTTADLGKYGEVEVNESSGTISPSIPLFEYNAGKMSLPISLNYSGNGVKVNQNPTWVGINWNLNPGGVITRTVKDMQDENIPNYRQFPTATELDLLPGAQDCDHTLSPWFLQMEALNSNNVDTEVDIFNYNFMGYSGSFFLDLNNHVHLIKYDKELKINFFYNSNNKSEIVITTPEGDTFFFGGANASESSRSFVAAEVGSATSNSPFTQNAFYLYRVSFLNGGSIFFDYEPNVSDVCLNKIGVQESASFTNTVPRPPCNSTRKDIFEQFESSIQLKRIRSSYNDQYVEFDTSTVNSCANLYKLNNVYLKDSNNTIINKVSLQFLTLNVENIFNLNKKKYFLQKVKFYNKDLQFENEYELNYKTPHLFPNRDSFAQDELGNYNGITTNTSLIMGCSAVTNREAIPEKAIIGSLEKIKYPTGGYSTFEYELPFKNYSYFYQPNFISLYYRDSNRNFTSSPHTTTSNYNTYTNGVFFPMGDDHLVTTMPSNIAINLRTEVNGNYSHDIILIIKVIKSNGSEIVKSFSINSNPNYDNQVFNHSHTFNLEPGSYTFQYLLKIHCADSHNCSGTSQNNLNSVLTNASLGLPNGIKTNYYPGLRIKRIETIDNNGNIEKKRYYYNKYENRFTESYIFNPNYTYITHIRNPSGSLIIPFLDRINITANSVKSIFYNDIGSYIYDNITVSYGGDNFEKGGKEMNFYKISTSPINRYGITSRYVATGTASSPLPIRDCDFNESYNSFVDIGINDAFQNSVLQKETFFNNLGRVLKSTEYIYSMELDNIVNNMKIYNYNQFTYGNLYLMYATKSYKYRKTTTVTKEYFGNSSTPLINTTTNTFSPDKVSLPRTINYTNSIGNTKTTRLYYPSDANNINEYSPLEKTNLSVLNNGKHNVSEIVKLERYDGEELLESKLNHYSNFNGNVLPSSISYKKNQNSFEDRIDFHNYDFHGNPILVSKRDGMKIRYFYNSKKQVILKIENDDSEVVIDDNLNPSTTPCYYQNQYPQAMVTQYIYDPLSNNLISIVDPKCDKITYHYDSFGRLQFVKDKNGNILSEKEYNYKP